MQIDYLIAIGILLVAIGSILTYFVGKKESEKSQKETNEKLDDFKRHLLQSKNEMVNSVSHSKKIEEIENEYDAWAKELKANYSEIILSHEKSLMQQSEKKIAINKRWNNFFMKTFDDINKIALSINKQFTENKIEIHKSSERFPTDLFNKEAKEYYLILGFTKANLLRVNIGLSSIRVPSLYFTLSHDFETVKNENAWILAKNKLTVSFNDEGKGFGVVNKEGAFSDFQSDLKDYDQIPLNDFDLFIKSIITYQLISSKKST